MFTADHGLFSHGVVVINKQPLFVPRVDPTLHCHEIKYPQLLTNALCRHLAEGCRYNFDQGIESV